ncbi:MAG: hypothetical protein DSZ27_02170 [Thiomicrospira sp.]|nr:MAG: hypothetical protein DSZ27_02170 [Thiomicrospira sp.]
MSFKLLSLQYASFFKDVVMRPNDRFKGLNDHLNIFDSIPQTMPIPDSAPPEIPVQVLKSSDDKYTCNLSRSRIDFILQRAEAKTSNKDILKDFNNKVDRLIPYILDKEEINRFGMVAKYFFETKDPIDCIKNKYFSDNMVDGSYELGVRFNKRDSLENMIVNDVVEIYSGQALIEGQEKSGIIILRDINNSPVLDGELSHKDLMKISQKYSSRLTEESIEGLLL